MEFTVFDWMIDSGLRGNELIVFAYICTFGKDAGTQTDIARAIGITRENVNRILTRLQHKGFVEILNDGTNKIAYGVTKRHIGVTNHHKGCDESSQMCDETSHVKSGDTSLINNNNNIYITHTNPTRARASETDIEWHDAPFAARMADGIANGGTMRDDMVRSLTASTGIKPNTERLAQMADAFAADQRVADSNHTNDGDFRMHFIRWAASILKAEAKQRHVDEKVSERNQRRNMTSFERAQLSRDQAERRFMEELQQRLNNDMNNGR